MVACVVAGRSSWRRQRPSTRGVPLLLTLDLALEMVATLLVAGRHRRDFYTFDSRLSRIRTRETNATALGKPSGLSEAAWWKQALLPGTGYADPLPLSAWTFQDSWPFFRAKLDWIAAAGGIVPRCGIGPFSSSDHRPVLDRPRPGRLAQRHAEADGSAIVGVLHPCHPELRERSEGSQRVTPRSFHRLRLSQDDRSGRTFNMVVYYPGAL